METDFCAWRPQAGTGTAGRKSQSLWGFLCTLGAHVEGMSRILRETEGRVVSNSWLVEQRGFELRTSLRFDRELTASSKARHLTLGRSRLSKFAGTIAVRVAPAFPDISGGCLRRFCLAVVSRDFFRHRRLFAPLCLWRPNLFSWQPKGGGGSRDRFAPLARATRGAGRYTGPVVRLLIVSIRR